MTYKIEKYDFIFQNIRLYTTLFLKQQIYAVFRD